MHLDVERRTIEMVRKEALKRSISIDGISSVITRNEKVSDSNARDYCYLLVMTSDHQQEEDGGGGVFGWLVDWCVQDIEIQLKSGKTVLFEFDSNADVAIFQETVYDLMNDSYDNLIKYPRNIERKSSIEKRGASGLFQKRYAVLIPGKLYIMRSSESYFPVQVFTLPKMLER